MMKRVLFFSPNIAYPPIGGPWRRSYINFVAVTRVATTHLAVCGGLNSLNSFENSGIQHFRDLAAGVHPIQFGSSIYKTLGITDRLLNRSARTLRRIWFRYHDACDVAEGLAALVTSLDIDIVWLCYASVTLHCIPVIRAAKPNVRIVADTDSVWSDYIFRGLGYTAGVKQKLRILYSGLRKRHEEKVYARHADLIACVSEADRDIYKGLCGFGPRYVIIPNVIDIKSYARTQQHEVLPLPGHRVVFTGTMCTAAHADAIRWFAKQILPLITEQIPDIKFYVVGRDPLPEIMDCASHQVIVTGLVKSVLPYLYGAIAAIVPLRFESGTRSKIVEAFACGTPVVSTTLGKEGLSIENGEHLLVADSEPEFANAVIRLARDQQLTDALTARSLEWAKEHYDVTVAYRVVGEVIADL